jgi:outer membrane lipoprotein-sorting protein
MKKILLFFTIALVFISGFAVGQEAAVASLDLEALSAYDLIKTYQTKQSTDGRGLLAYSFKKFVIGGPEQGLKRPLSSSGAARA